MPIKAIVFDAYGTLYDVQSVGGVIEAAFPGRGPLITEVWRLKQLEYSWLRTLMHRWEDFWSITREALAYTLGIVGLEPEPALFDRITEAYNHLAPYPDTAAALLALAPMRLAILSNGSAAMLDALVRNSGFADRFDAVISIDPKRAFKPDPRAYELVEERLGLPPREVLFVSSNGFDIAGAKSFGFTVARIERVTRAALHSELAAATLAPAAFYKALRSQIEAIGVSPDVTIATLRELPDVVAGIGAAAG